MSILNVILSRTTQGKTFYYVSDRYGRTFGETEGTAQEEGLDTGGYGTGGKRQPFHRATLGEKGRRANQAGSPRASEDIPQRRHTPQFIRANRDSECRPLTALQVISHQISRIRPSGCG